MAVNFNDLATLELALKKQNAWHKTANANFHQALKDIKTYSNVLATGMVPILGWITGVPGWISLQSAQRRADKWADKVRLYSSNIGKLHLAIARLKEAQNQYGGQLPQQFDEAKAGIPPLDPFTSGVVPAIGTAALVVGVLIAFSSITKKKKDA